MHQLSVWLDPARHALPSHSREVGDVPTGTPYTIGGTTMSDSTRMYVVTWREGVSKRRQAFTSFGDADLRAADLAEAYHSTFVTLTPYDEAGNPEDPILYFWDYDARMVRSR